jgi:DNA-binding transcriptional LysR family regulator
MTHVTSAEDQLTVAFDRRVPLARWGPLFHVLCLEQPGLRLHWRPSGLPPAGRSLLDGADVGLFFEPPPDDELSTLTVETSQMVVVMAVGHRLAGHHELSVTEVLDEPSPRGPNLGPRWTSSCTLDEQGLEAVVAGRAIATVPASVAGSLRHPGVVAVALTDAPVVAIRLVWRCADQNPLVGSLVDLARSMSGRRPADVDVSATAQ